MNSHKEKVPHLLFTPGPLTTSDRVKQAMLRDLGSREPAFLELVQSIRCEVLDIAGVSSDAGYECVPIQGSGTFGIESVIGSAIPRDGKLLAVVNGAYGRRIVEIAKCLGVDYVALEFGETSIPDIDQINEALEGDSSITHVAVVHCETTTGILNPIESIAEIVSRHGRTLVVDAMSSFGGIPIDLDETKVGFLVSSSNKCLEGVPGFSFVLARKELLELARGNARSVSLDLAAQWDGLEENGQFRFTPPTHVMLAFGQALAELRSEGGVETRFQRFCRSRDALVSGMEEMGFKCLIRPQLRSPIITAFAELEDSRFEFEALYERLARLGFIIYPGKVNQTSSFRIGTIGKIDHQDISLLLGGIRESLEAMGVFLASNRLSAADSESKAAAGQIS